MHKNQKLVGRAYVEAKRAQYVEQLSVWYRPLYLSLCDELDRLGGEYWAPTSGIRTLEAQTKLYAQGRTEKGPIVTNARPGYSAHNWGCATDWAEMRPEFRHQEMWDKANWNQYSQAVRGVKAPWGRLEWGGAWTKFVDKPHNELQLKVSWKKVGDVYTAQGYDEAIKFIEQNLWWEAKNE